MDLTILTPDAEVFKGNASRVVLPGVGGQFEVLSNHAPLVSALEAGVITVTTSDRETLTFSNHKGFVEVLNNEVSILLQGVEKA